MKYTIIKSKKQYIQYCDLLEGLVVKDKKKDQDEIDLLGLLIEDYTNRIMEGKMIKLDPVQLIRELINEHQMTQIALSKKLQVSPQLITDILKYRREITKKLAYKLGEIFKLNFSIFLQPYQLKKVS